MTAKVSTKLSSAIIVDTSLEVDMREIVDFKIDLKQDEIDSDSVVVTAMSRSNDSLYREAIQAMRRFGFLGNIQLQTSAISPVPMQELYQHDFRMKVM